MKRDTKEKRYLLISILLCLIPIAIGTCFYNVLPSEMPIHFNSHNLADGFASKKMVLFGMPIIFILFVLFTDFMLRNDPKKDNHSRELVYLFYLFIPLLSVLTSSISISYALGYRPNIGAYLIRLMALFFIGVGNLLPKTKRNYTMGIKVPWTLDSDENWNKTHRFAGFVWIVLSILMLIISFISYEFLVQIFLIILIIMIILPIIYSYILYHRDN